MPHFNSCKAADYFMMSIFTSNTLTVTQYIPGCPERDNAVVRWSMVHMTR